MFPLVFFSADRLSMTCMNLSLYSSIFLKVFPSALNEETSLLRNCSCDHFLANEVLLHIYYYSRDREGNALK